jgi:hypothetical protein
VVLEADILKGKRKCSLREGMVVLNVQRLKKKTEIILVGNRMFCDFVKFVV